MPQVPHVRHLRHRLMDRLRHGRLLKFLNDQADRLEISFKTIFSFLQNGWSTEQIAHAQMPVNTVAPAITPTSITTGGVATCSQGTWTGATEYEYFWYQDGNFISGASNKTLTITAAMLTHAITCRVNASNAVGSVVIAETAAIHPA